MINIRLIVALGGRQAVMLELFVCNSIKIKSATLLLFVRMRMQMRKWNVSSEFSANRWHNDVRNMTTNIFNFIYFREFIT